MKVGAVNPRKLMGFDAYTFLIKELEKVDETILEPLSGTDWPRDMPVITGGGIVENVSSIDVSYASSGGEEDNLIFEAANDIPVIQADLAKNSVPTFNFAEYMVFNALEPMKMEAVGRNPEEFLDKGIRLHFDHYVDLNVYKGFKKVKSTGLLNNANITRVSAAPVTPGGTNTQWSGKTADQILADINALLSGIWTANECSSDAIPNHILVPVEQFGMLVTNKVSDDSERSILTYVLENNIAAAQGKELIISPCRFCSGIGTGGKNRMVAYMNQEDRICINLTQPLKRMETEYTNMRYKIPYFGQFSGVRFLYPSTVRYMDGI